MGTESKQIRTPGDIADETEVLRLMTDILRGTLDGAPKVSERCRAAELLGKRMGLFEPAEERAGDRRAAAEAIGEALRRMREEHGPGSA